MRHKNILFLLKKRENYGEDYYNEFRSGLLNSASFVKEFLNRSHSEFLHHHFSVTAFIKIIQDGNCIERELVAHNAGIVILEAVWCPPEKLRQLHRLHPHVLFIVRVHSKIAFIANEGMAIDWITQYSTIPKVVVSFNDLETVEHFESIGIKGAYLPNVYKQYPTEGSEKPHKHKKRKQYYDDGSGNLKPIVEIGCYGAIRPMKNTLNQAIAAIMWANKNNVILHFNINAGRVEQRGDTVLKNLRALFAFEKHHKLVEHGWLSYHDFRNLCGTMDIGMQVSLSETFNIVAADFVSTGVPCIVSKEISWMPFISKADCANIDNIAAMINLSYRYSRIVNALSKFYLNKYNKRAERVWLDYLKQVV